MVFWVKHLKIEHFRGISHLELDFSPENPIVLIGINGVGKSSILDCLVILLSWYVSAILCRIFQGQPLQGTDIARLTARNDLPVGIGFKDADIQNNFEETTCNIQLSPSIGMSEWSMSYSRNDRSKNADVSSWLPAIQNSVNHLFENADQIGIPLVLNYPVNRAISDISLDAIENTLSKYWGYDIVEENSNSTSVFSRKISLSVDAGFQQFFRWFRTVEDVENEQRRDDPSYRDRQLEAVRNAIASLLPGFSNLRVRRSPLRMTITKENEDLVITQLSDGEKCLLAMVGDMARRLAIANPNLDDPLRGSGIIMIDEIELHLHPEWQRRVIPSLTTTFPNCQFIVTTHSPIVVSHVQPEGIFMLKKEGAEITASHPESSFGRDSNRILEDLMGVTARPAAVQSDLMELFRLIDEGNLEQARQLRQDLATRIGGDEPSFVKADVLIRRKEILNG